MTSTERELQDLVDYLEYELNKLRNTVDRLEAENKTLANRLDREFNKSSGFGFR